MKKIEQKDQLKIKVEDFLQSRGWNGLQFCKAANISINKFYFWLHSDFSLDTLSCAAIVGFLNQNK